MAYRRFQPAGYRVNISCIPIGRNALAQWRIFRHYVATAHSYPINELRAVMWYLAVPRAGRIRGSGRVLVGTRLLGLGRTG